MIKELLRNEWRRTRGGIIWTAVFTAAALAYAAVRWLPRLDSSQELCSTAGVLLLAWVVVLFVPFGSDKPEMPLLNGLPVAPGLVYRSRLISRLVILAAVTAAVWYVTEYPANIQLATPVPVLSGWIFGGEILFFALLAGLLICVSAAGSGAWAATLCLGIPLIALCQIPAAVAFAVYSFEYFPVWVALQVFVLLAFTGERLWLARCTARPLRRAALLPLALLLVLPWLEFAAVYIVAANELNSKLQAAEKAGTHMIPAEWADALDGHINKVDFDRIIGELRSKLDSGNRGYFRAPLTNLNYYLNSRAGRELRHEDYPKLLETLNDKLFLFSWGNDIIVECIGSKGDPGFFRELLRVLENSHTDRTPRQLYAAFDYEKLRNLQWPETQPKTNVPRGRLNRIFILKPLLLRLQSGELDKQATFRKWNIDQSSREKENVASENARLEQLEALVKIRLYQFEHGEFPEALPEDIQKLAHGMRYSKTPSGFRAESARYNHFAMEYDRK